MYTHFQNVTTYSVPGVRAMASSTDMQLKTETDTHDLTEPFLIGRRPIIVPKRSKRGIRALISACM